MKPLPFVLIVYDAIAGTILIALKVAPWGWVLVSFAVLFSVALFLTSFYEWWVGRKLE
jgi:hypothetical protein